MTEEQIQKILAEFYETASREKQEELRRLLRKRGKNLTPDIDPARSAQNIAKNISEQMGLTGEQIQKSAREIVAQMILQYDPHISKDELMALIDRFTSGGHNASLVPPGLIISMLSHLTDYSLGRMPRHVYMELPEGWTKKYWEHLPESIQKLFADFIRQKISEQKFWEAVKSSLNET